MANVHGFGELREQQQPQQGQLFYAGGQKSGVAIEGPASAADRLFAQQQQRSQQQHEATADGAIIRVTVVMWREGFTVQEHPGDVSPLRAYDAPGAREFVDALAKNELPREFRAKKARGATTYDFELVDRRTRAFADEALQRQPKAPSPASFAGVGMRLGSSSSSSSSSAPSQQTTTTTTAAAPTVDEGKPTTQVQVRLASGQRLVGRFNPDVHTVADLRAFVDSKAPSSSAYDLATAVPPPRVLSDMGQTLSQANLLNAAVVQRLR